MYVQYCEQMCVTSTVQDRRSAVGRVNNYTYLDGAPLGTFKVVETRIKLGAAIDGNVLLSYLDITAWS